MFATWIQIMSQQIKRHGWYDAFGDLFMALTSQSGQQQKGQFFTPAHITDLMSKITMGKQESDAKILSVCDPTAGSGRTLLAAKADRPQSYLVAWDIDYTCCLMCVCNFLINGCVGEVVCIDSLRMDNFRGAWIVNEALCRTGLPTVRKLDERVQPFQAGRHSALRLLHQPERLRRLFPDAGNVGESHVPLSGIPDTPNRHVMSHY